MLLFLFIFVSGCFFLAYSVERYQKPDDHILIRCGEELMQMPKVVKAVNFVAPFAAKINMKPLKFLAILAYISVFVFCVLVALI